MNTIKVEIPFTEEEKKKLNEINDDQQLRLDKVMQNAQQDGIEVVLEGDALTVKSEGTIAAAAKAAMSLRESICAILEENEEEETPPTVLKEVVEKFTKLAEEYRGSVRMGLVTWCGDGIGYSGNIPAEIAKLIIDGAVS